MIVFRYDRSFEGLLTAVFDAFARRQTPDAAGASSASGASDASGASGASDASGASGASDASGAWGAAGAADASGGFVLLAEGDVAPLFVDAEHTVVTDPAKSSRVWTALEAKLSREVCNMLFFAWLSEEPSVDLKIFRFICRTFREKISPATDFTDPNVLRIKQLAQKVTRERTALMQFTRFQRTADPDATDSSLEQATFEGDSGGNENRCAGTFFAPVSPRYNALPLAIPFFRDRFRDQKWLIYDIRRRYGFYYDLRTVTEITMDDDAQLLTGKLDPDLMAEDEKLFQELWRTYFGAMAIEARINPRLQRQHLPKRFWHLLTEMQ